MQSEKGKAESGGEREGYSPTTEGTAAVAPTLRRWGLRRWIHTRTPSPSLGRPMAEAPPWSDLPSDLAAMVLGLLPSHVDRVRFAAVCAHWHSAIRLPALPQPLPLLLLPDGTLCSLPWSESFRLPGCSNYVSTCGKWLFFSNGNNGCFLMDSFSKATMTLPALASIRLPYGDSQCTNKKGIMQMIRESKLVLCSPQLVEAIFSVCGSNHIALCRPGGSSWSILMEKQFRWEFHHMAFHKGKLYTLSCNEDLVAIDITKDDTTGDPWVSHLGQVINGNHGVSSTFIASENGNLTIKMLYLLESCDRLLMVRRTLLCRCRKPFALLRKDMEIVVEQNMFDVFEPDFRQSQWVQVTTIGDDQVLFLGRGCSRVVCVSQYDMLGDQIFFLEHDDEGWSWYNEESSSSFSAYNIRDRTFSSPLPMNSWKRKMGFAAWIFP